ncbi:hypothetical protein GGI21_003752 [Coemansia aciculifera]|nr:hypothetical protein GGI21_003752 [Coemansia aciculifera]
MPLVVPYMTTRARTAPVAELSNVMAYNSPPPRLAKAPGGSQLTKKKSYASLHSNALLHGRTSLDKKSITIPAVSHQRALELLRSVLAAAQGLGNGELKELSQAVHVIVAESIEPAARGFWGLTLSEQRASFIEALQKLQHPYADVIGSRNLLLCNRAAIGLLDSVSASDYNYRLQRQAAAAACGSSRSIPIAIVGLTPRTSAACSLSSSFDSAESDTTLVAADDVEEFFMSDEQTVVAEKEPAAMADHEGTCWPLSEAAKDITRSWGRFYADLGSVRVPSRFRVPRHSLAMLASEQLMMRNDKIVCPLKNRLQEANPRRQLFEDYIHATGTIPAQSRTPKPRLSPLCNSTTI